ncbi:MAG TPA: ribonuclease Y [Candidatus Enteromonas pullicola]|uniref:Ribonuclease Y n=1 Tax=Candidatus Alloenteromonas pullicola TaxID=2840784 RepID=A0A9D1LMS5_9FIRM|nr:ribonuclease Y [Candidatus Enteromonas pullicola]
MPLLLSEGVWIALVASLPVIVAVIAVLLTIFLTTHKAKAAGKSAESIVKEAKVKAEHIIKNAEIDAKQAAFEAKQKADNEIRERKSEISALEQKLTLREQSIDARDAALVSKENSLDQKQASLDRQIESYKNRQAELDTKIDDIIRELEKVSGMSTQQAHDEIMSRVESKMAVEIATFMKNAEDEAKEKAQANAVDLLSLACQRYAQDVTTERTVSVVALPNDEMKGRIIGREGRNIRVLEQELGVDLVIDDTPEAITVSCFDPIRREIARRTLEYLVKDGRIQPGRIEEVAAKCKKEVADISQKYGEEACFKLGLPKINKELVGYIGRLHFRTSYGQNALEHSMEVAYLSGLMAGELGLDVNLARRAGLLHDIGKSVDFEMEGSHVQLGAQLAKKYGESDVVINAIESHHGDVEARYVISHLVAAADTLSAARPGARSETLETYVKRIEQLEALAKGFDGVSQAYAMQSGREIRVMVMPDKVSDSESILLAQQLKDKIESEMTYPGQIKVSVIREYRAIETAK